MSQGWSKVFSRVFWKNRPNKTTELGAGNLNKGDFAIDEIDNRVIRLDEIKADKIEINGMVSDVSLDNTTGILTITYKDGSEKTYNTNLQKIAVNFRFDKETQRLVLVLPDGTEQYVDLSAFITDYEFADSSTIVFSVDSSGKASASIKNGSITEAMLETGYLANIKVEVAKAEAAATQAQSSEASSDYNAKLSRSYAIGSSGIRDGEDTDNAMYYCEQAQKTDASQIRKDLDNLTAESTIVKKSVGKYINDKGTLDGKAKLVNLPHNLLNPTLLTETTKNGITCTPNTDADGNFDGTYTLNGTASANALFDVAIVKLNAGTYRLIGCPSGGSSKTYWFYAYINISYGEYGSGCNIKAKSDGLNATIKIVINSGTTVENLVFKPMITDDLTATYDDFVPYESYEIKSCGKNLLNSILKTKSSNGITCTANGDGTYTLNGTATSNLNFVCMGRRAMIAGRYKICGCPSGGTKDTYSFVCMPLKGSGIYDTGDGVIFDATTENEQTYAIYISIRNGTTIENLVFKPMLTVDTDATYDDYEPYQSSSVTVTQDTTEAWIDTYDVETNIIAPISVTAMYGTNLQGNEIMKELYKNKNVAHDLEKLSYSDVAGGKNLLKVSAYTQTSEGVTVTNNGDGTYTANGTCAVSNGFTLGKCSLVKGKMYKLLGCPSGGATNKYMLYSDSIGTKSVNNTDENGAIFEAKETNENAYIYISFANGAVLDNVVFKPMVTEDLEASYDDFEPYIQSVKMLADEFERLLPMNNGKTIVSIYQATNESLAIKFSDNTVKYINLTS